MASIVVEDSELSAGNDSKASEPTFKHDWYQTETHVTVTILAKQLKPENLSVGYSQHKLTVSVSNPVYSLNLDLAHSIVPEQCSHIVTPTKVEIRLKKGEAVRWQLLEGKPHTKEKVNTDRDWDQVVSKLDTEEEDKQGEAALNALFQKIYCDGSDEVKKAMNKSFLESGGTVLSTNWSEVGQEKVKIKPPEGMEFKKWEQ